MASQGELGKVGLDAFEEDRREPLREPIRDFGCCSDVLGFACAYGVELRVSQSQLVNVSQSPLEN